MGKTKLLLLGDAPSAGTGLGRILGDLALRIHENLSDIYDIATFGYGGPGSRKYPFPQYVQEGIQADWVLPSFPQVWNDFAGNEKGICLVIWDVSRMSWFSQPKQSELLKKHPDLREFLRNRPFKTILYTPVDAEGPNGRLSFPLMKTLLGFDRIIAYGEWGEKIIRDTISDEEADKQHLTWLPHGVDSDVFYEEDRNLCRREFLTNTGAQHLFGNTRPIEKDETLVSIYATNQARKNFQLGIEAFAIFSQKHKARLHIHTDEAERYWSIPCLLIDYGIVDKTLISLGYISDQKMAQAYSASDILLGIGPEGWGLPLSESLACGTPVITGSYGGQCQFVPAAMQVHPVSFYHEGIFSFKRPVYDPQHWADAMETFTSDRGWILDPQYEWKSLWARWANYLRGVANENS